MPCAGVVLTGGSSRRMGRDKAAIRLGAGGATLASRTAALLAGRTDPAIELGPGVTGLPHRSDAGGGPLLALASAADLWAALPDDGAVVVVATDLPRLTGGLVDWLVAHGAPGAVVPVDAGRRQPLCARYRVTDLRSVPAAAAAGTTSLSGWLAGLEVHDAGPEEWRGPAQDPHALRDADTPDDLARLLPATGATAP